MESARRNWVVSISTVVVAIALLFCFNAPEAHAADDLTAGSAQGAGIINSQSSYKDYDEDIYEPTQVDNFTIVAYGDTSLEVSVMGDWRIVHHRFFFRTGFGHSDPETGAWVQDPDRWEDYTYESTVSGAFVPGALVTATVNGITSSALTDSNGYATVGIPIALVGTPVEITASMSGKSVSKTVTMRKTGDKFSYGTELTEGDDDAYDEDFDSREDFRDNIEVKPTYRKDKATVVKVYQATAGDYIKFKIGKKTYKKRVRASRACAKIVVKHKAYKAGTKIKVSHYNAYNQLLGKAKTIVFYSGKVKKGMTRKEVKQSYCYNHPDSEMSGNNGWVSYDGVTYYFRGGRVSRIYTY